MTTPLQLTLGAALFSLGLACGAPSALGPAPTVQSTAPIDGAMEVALNGAITANFSEAMDSASLTSTTFTLTSGIGEKVVPGTVTSADFKAHFWPTAHLAPSTVFHATITTEVTSAAGVAVATTRSWTFATGTSLAEGQQVPLGAAGDFALLATEGISALPGSGVTGDVGVSPATSKALSGFDLMPDGTGAFSSSPRVEGRVLAADDASPTPATLSAAVADQQLAFTDAAGRASDVTELQQGALDDLVLAPGVYRWSTDLTVPGELTLKGGDSEVWVFQVAGQLTLGHGARVTLVGGALPRHVFWQVAGQVEVGPAAHLEGVVMAQGRIALGSSASVCGRLLSQRTISLDCSTVVQPRQ